MSNLLQFLADGLAAVKAEEIVGVPNKIGKGEIEIGEVNGELQRYFTFLNKYRNDQEAKMLEAVEAVLKLEGNGGKDHDPETCPGCRLRMELDADKVLTSALDDLFWAYLRSGLSTSNKIKIDRAGGKIGIRDGWKIVIVPNDNANTTDFISRLRITFMKLR